MQFSALTGVRCLAVLRRLRDSRLAWLGVIEGGGTRSRRITIRVLLLAASAATIAIGAYYRFDEITRQGISEGDTIGYYAIAKNWAAGNRTDFWGDNFYRPVVYELNAIALRWFGDNDYSIKVMNGIFDVGSIALMILLGRHLSGKTIAGVAAALVFAMMPYGIELCRSGMPHALSGFFVVLSLFIFQARRLPQSAGPVRLLLDAGAGFSLGLAANTHAELAFIGPGLVLCQGVQAFGRGLGWRAFGRFVLRAAVLTLGFFLTFAIGAWLFGYDTLIRVMTNEVSNHSFTPAYIVHTPLRRVPLDILTISSDRSFLRYWWIPLYTILPLAVGIVRLPFRRGRMSPAVLAPWILIVTYMLIFPLIIGSFDVTHVRIFFPLYPLFMIAASCAVASLAGPRSRFWSTALVAVSTALVLYFTPNAAAGPGYVNNPRWHHRSVFRVAYDTVGERIDQENRLLIVPSTALYNQGYQLDFYFGTNAVYLADQMRTEPYTPEFLHRIALKGKFSYLLAATWIDSSFANPNFPSTLRGRPWFLTAPDVPYDKKAELTLLDTFYAQYAAHPVARLPEGTFYSLRKRPLFFNSTFSRGTLVSWREKANAPAFAIVGDDSGRFFRKFHLDSRASGATPEGDQKAAATGTLESAQFTIEDDLIGFSLAGTGGSDQIGVELLVGADQLHASPKGEEFSCAEWDVSAYRGQTARIVVRDLDPDPTRGIAVTGFYYVL